MSASLIIVDADPIFRKRQTSFFKERGFEVASADRLDDIDDVVEPDLLLIDELLLDEASLSRLVRLKARLPQVRLILTTVEPKPTHPPGAPPHVEHRIRGEVHFDAIQHKPISPIELIGHLYYELNMTLPATPAQHTPPYTSEVIAPNVDGHTDPDPFEDLSSPGMRMSFHAITPEPRRHTRPQLDEQRADQRISSGPSPASPHDIERRLSTVRGVYGRRLPGLLATLKRALDHARHDPQAIQDARRLALQIRGTAGSFGFEQTANAVGIIHAQLDSLESSPADPATRWARIEQQFEVAHTATPDQETDKASRPRDAYALLTRVLIADPPGGRLEATSKALERRLLHVERADSWASLHIKLKDSDQPYDAIIISAHLEPSLSGDVYRRLIEQTPSSVLVVVGASDLSSRLHLIRQGVSIVLGSKEDLDDRQGACAPALRDLLAAIAERRRGAPRTWLLADDPRHAARCRALVHGAKLPCREGSLKGTDPSSIEADLIVLGHDRANLGGLLQTVRALRADPRHARTPVVCISETSISEKMAGACLEAGIDELIMMQIDQASLATRLQARLRRAASPTRTDARMHFARQAHDIVERARRFEKALSVVLIELESSVSQSQDPWHVEESATRFAGALERNLTPDDLHTRWTDGAFALLLNEAMPPGAFLGQLQDSNADLPDLPAFRAAIARFPEDSATLTGLFAAADARLADARADAPGSIVDSVRFRAITSTR